MATVGFGFREVIIDEAFGGKWMDVDMNLGGGHGTFQGTKFCDRAGGFSYKASPSPRQIMQNRFIYWRVLNDMLELTEISMDYNLEDNQIRYIFRDSPIVSPISIQEDDDLITIMIVTVTSVNRFTFNHPNRIFSEDTFNKKRQPSIFHQVLNKPSMILKTFNLFDHAINIPVPTTAAAFVMPYRAGHVFALAYESGSVTICKVTTEDTLVLYDLRQANIFARLLSSYTPSLLRGPSNSPDAVVGLNFFTGKVDRNKKVLFLCTLSMNGHLRLYMCNNLQSVNDWTVVSDVIVDKRFALDNYTDCNMLLRINTEILRLPKFAVFVPGEGFKIFETVRKASTLELLLTDSIDFKEPLMDFNLTNDFLFILVSNPDEETDWEVKSYNLNDRIHPRFNLALLEPPPYSDAAVFPPSLEPKEFYFDLVFNKSSFSAQTIYSALSTFESSGTMPKHENDWELTKQFAVRVIENEIRMDMTATDEPLPDEEYYEIVLKYWLGFYNSCVEYHINTVKPLGLFYETNTQMVCMVKKSRISFLRPTDFFETLLYFPHCVTLGSVSEQDERSAQIEMLSKYCEIMDFIESTVDQPLKNKVNKRLSENRARVSFVCAEIANLLIEADPYSEVLETRHFIPMLSTKLKDLGTDGDPAMRLILTLLASWDREAELLDVGIADEMDERSSVTEFFMGSRYGANITQRILKQLLQHRFLILRNTLILQSLINNYFARHGDGEGARMVPSLQDQKEAQDTLVHCFGLLGMLEKSAEFVPDSLLEKGLKVANVLNVSAIDHVIQGKLAEFWPLKLVEMFCHSSTGGLAVRSRINQFRNSKIVAYADAAGRTIWPSEDSQEHPFEEFLISACQFTALDQYTTNMTAEIPNGKPTLKKFYHGISNLFSGDYDLALGRFRSISTVEITDDSYFCNKILARHGHGTGVNPGVIFFQKAINLFQIFGHTIAVQILAEDALKNSTESRWTRVMSVLGFKSALIIGDYLSAYKFVCRMPHEEKTVGKEKTSSLRTFISQILERCDIDVLMSLDMDDTFFKLTATKEEIDKILSMQARLSNPLAEDGVYQMIYLYHLSTQNYRKAASAMLERVIQIGAKGKGKIALQAQKESYLDILTCLSLVEDPLLAFATRHEELDFMTLLGNMKPTEGSAPGEDIWRIVVPPENATETRVASEIRTYADAKRECELCISLLLLDGIDSDPIRFNDGSRRAGEAVEYLTLAYRFDEAIKLAGMWDIPYLSIVRAFTVVCVNLNYDILPRGGDPSDYVRHLDLSDLPNSGMSSVVEVALMVLQNYIKKLEKPVETFLHQAVALEFLSYSINLPRWLSDSYKKRDVSQLMNCYLRYGEWEEATNIAVDVMDAALGRRDAQEFDPSIQPVTAYLADPVIPYTAIDALAGELNARKEAEPNCVQLFTTLKQRCDDYVIRVNETRRERVAMFSA